jgi:hypothetical protein
MTETIRLRVKPALIPVNGVVQSIVAGTNVTVDATDPANPIVSATGGGGGTGTVETIVAGAGISVDSTDPANPIVSATGSGSGDMLAATYDPQAIADDAFDRANHTGTQAASTISDFDTEVSNNSDVAANTAARHVAVTVTDSSEINFTLVGQDITAALIAGSIDETKLDASVNASLTKVGHLTVTQAVDLDAMETKLAGIEALADVTDAANVNAAGAVMNSDTSTAAMSFVVDEDNFASDSATKVPTQQSVKAYVDAAVIGGGGYNDEQAQDAVGGILANSAEITLTYSDATPSITAALVAGSIDESKLDASVNASLDLADSALQASAIGVSVQAYDADLATWAGLTPSANAQSLVTAANYAAMRALLDLEAGTDFYSIAAADAAFQPKDSDLTSWAGVTRASGFDTFATTPSSANLRALLSDEAGAGAAYFVGGALGTPASGTATNLTGLPLSSGVTGQLPLANGGTGANLTDPNADRVMFWDDSAGVVTWLTMGTGLTITGTTLDAAGAGGMTFLGTITTTSGSTQSLSSLNLTSYKYLKLSLNAVSLSGAGAIQMNGVQISAALAAGSNAAYGNVDIDLTNGIGSAVTSAQSGGGGTAVGFASGLTTASTTVTVTASAGTFDAGSVRVYGVA